MFGYLLKIIYIEMIIALSLSIAHVPYFSTDLSTTGQVPLQLPSDISQVYYFKESGVIYSNHDLPRNDLVQLIGPKQIAGGCFGNILCDNTNTIVAMGTNDSSKAEPFTQSEYFTYFNEDLTCHHTFIINVSCLSPWGGVVGKKEDISAMGGLGLLKMPVTIARIHGSWWNGQYYIIGYMLLFYPIIFIWGLTCLRERALCKVFLMLAAWTNFAFFIEKLVCTIVFAMDAAFAWVLTYAELIPLCLAVSLIFHPNRILALSSVGVSIVFLFLFGIGFLLGNIFLFVGAVSLIS